MVDQKTHRTSFINQILLLLMAIVMLYLLADFGRQLAGFYQRRQELQQIEAQITAEQQKMQALEERLGYWLSPAAPEQWGRENGWAREGEQTVVIVGQNKEGQLQPEESGASAPGTTSTRSAWWDLFFGEP